MDEFVLRPYQREAIESWKSSSWVSMLEMATGTGKTITAVAAVLELSLDIALDGDSVLIIVVCPYLNLVDQWTRQFRDFDVESHEACETAGKWQAGLENALGQSEIKRGTRVVVVATQATFTGPVFQRLIQSTSSQIVLVADEVHNMGSKRSLSFLPKAARYRLGLSATPERWGDEGGRAGLAEYFGDISFRLNLKEAISFGYLSRYKYFPRVVKLSDVETQSYADLTVELARVLGGARIEDLDAVRAKRAGAILRARAALIGDADGKLEEFEKDFQGNLGAQGQLIYCSEGSSLSTSRLRQIERVQALISRTRSVRGAIYDSAVKREERQLLLQKFSNGDISHLLSMRCLDEGVDVPSANVAYILASSANPRQFVQRRGRVLRNAPGKALATIYDYFVMPRMSGELARLESENRIMERELARTMEFIDACENKSEAMAAIASLRGANGGLRGGNQWLIA